MPSFRRVHYSGTETVVEQHGDRWHATINFLELDHTPTTIAGFFSPTAEKAKVMADEELIKHGHICNGKCKGWFSF